MPEDDHWPSPDVYFLLPSFLWEKHSIDNMEILTSNLKINTVFFSQITSLSHLSIRLHKQKCQIINITGTQAVGKGYKGCNYLLWEVALSTLATNQSGSPTKGLTSNNREINKERNTPYT